VRVLTKVFVCQPRVGAEQCSKFLQTAEGESGFRGGIGSLGTLLMGSSVMLCRSLAGVTPEAVLAGRFGGQMPSGCCNYTI
jgi:hypothetical protein